MAADTIVTGAKLTAIADALRAKLGAQDAYTLDEIATAIASIQAGNDHLARSLLNYPGRSTDEGEYRWAFGAGDAAALASHYEGMATTLSVRPFAFAYSPVTSIVLPEVSGNSGLGIGPAAFSRSAVESIALPPTWRMETFQSFTDGFSLVGASGVDFYTSPFCSCKRLRSLDLTGCVGNYFSYMNYLVAGCEALESVTLPTGFGATKLANSAFRRCRSLTRVEIPANFTNLYQSASGTFQENDALEEVDILGSPKILGGQYSSFFYSTFTSANTTFRRLIIRGSAMAQVVGTSGTVLTSNGFVFGSSYDSSAGGYVANVPANLRIYVPDDLVATYKADASWGNYADIILPISDLGE